MTIVAQIWNGLHCPECNIKLPLRLLGSMPRGPRVEFFCRSKRCKGKWIEIDIGVPVLLN